MPWCKYCGAEIEWIEDHQNRKPDGSPRKVPLNTNNSRHDCPQFQAVLERSRMEREMEYQKKLAEEAAQRQAALNLMWKLPVYCVVHMEYYPSDAPCQHLKDIGFVAHTPDNSEQRWSYPPLFHFNHIREQSHKARHKRFGLDQTDDSLEKMEVFL